MDSYNDATCIDLDSDVAAIATSSLLRCFPPEDSRSVLLTLFKSVSVIRPGTNEVVITIGGKEATVALATVGSTEFFIQLLSYGLSLSTVDYEPLAKCVAICTEWIAALIVERYSQLPAPIVARHEFYLDLLLKMLVEIFRLRESSKQPLLCHLVLRRIEETARENISIIRRDVWQQVLVFALRTSSIVFQSVGAGLPEFSQRAASVLVHLWLAACVSCFPPPPLWKTLAALLPKWRHSQPVVDQWGVAVVWLTSLLTSTCFPDRNIQSFVVHNANSQQAMHWAYLASAFQQKPTVLSQTWYRLLHAAGRPADLCKPSSFLLSTLPPPNQPQPQPTQEQLIAFIKAMPAIFHSSVYTLACVSDLLLGIQCSTIAASQLNYLSPQQGTEGDELGSSGLSSGTLPNASAASMQSSSSTHQRKSSRKALTQKVVGRPVSMAGLMGSLTHSAASAVSGNTSSVAPLSTPPSSSSVPSSASSSSVSTLASVGALGATPAALTGMVTSASSVSISSSGQSSSSLAQTPPQILIAISNPKNVRPAVSTLLNLVGGWLMDAIFTAISPPDAFFGGTSGGGERPRSGSTVELEAAIQAALISVTNTSDQSAQLLKLFSTGVAEALGSLCRLVGSCRRWGPVSEASKMRLVNFARFQQIIGLSLNSGHSHLLGSILLNGAWSLFHGQLPGVTFLVPDAVAACRLALKTSLMSEQKIVHATIAITCALGSLPGSAFSIVIDSLFDCLVASIFPSWEVDAMQSSSLTYSLETLQLQLASILVLLVSANLTMQQNAETISTIKTPITLFTSALPAICRLLIVSSHKAPSSGASGGGTRDHAPQGRQLCALELLAACAPLLARASTSNPASAPAGQQLAYMVMLSLCQMIETECSRPPTEHSRDLHSVIVAAYGCLSIWVANCGSGFCTASSAAASSLSAAPPATPLVACREFFARVMRVIELGLTGTMSASADSLSSSSTDPSKGGNQALTPTTPITILPVSRRVQLSAETLLHVVLSSPQMAGMCRPFATSCCIDEVLLRNYQKPLVSGSASPSSGLRSTVEEHTYCLSDSVIATFLPTRSPLTEKQSVNQLNNGVLMLIRNPHGRYCWLMSTQPITALSSSSGSTFSCSTGATSGSVTASPESHGVNNNNGGSNFHSSPSSGANNSGNNAGGAIGRRFQPPGTDFVGTVQADWNLPRSLTGSWTDTRPETMKTLLARDAQRTSAKLASMPRGRPADLPKPPQESRNQLFLDRLLLNHLAYTKPTAGQRGRFAMLDLEAPTAPSLSSLIDVLSDRLSATLWCFYCPPVSTPSESGSEPPPIVPLQIPSDVAVASPLFWELIEAVAWPRPIVANSQPKPPYDGSTSSGILYWADSTIELTVLSPNVANFSQNSASAKFHHHHPTAVLCFLEDPDTDRDVILRRLQLTLDRLYQSTGGTPVISPFILLVSLTGTGAFRLMHVGGSLGSSGSTNSSSSLTTTTTTSAPPTTRQHLSTSLFFAAAGLAPGGLVVSRKAAASFIRQAVIGQAMRTHLVLSAAAPTAASLEGTTPASRRQQRIEGYRRSTAVELSEPDLFASLLTGRPPQRQVEQTATSSTSPPNSQTSRFSAGLIIASGVS